MSTFFSIIIPCYNQSCYLTDCLDSLLEQSYSTWEAIVVNDGSPDNTNEVTLNYARRDSRIKLVEKQNGGLSSARNYGIKYAKGDRLVFLDADDFLYDDYLEEINNVADNIDENTLIQCGYSYITEDKERILSHVKAFERKSYIPEIFKANLGPCHSICISKKLVQNIGLFDETLKSVEDWDFWMRAIKAGGVVRSILKPMVYYRYSKGSMSRNPFVLFEALKTVIYRGPRKDDRILIDSYFNTDYDFNTKDVLQDVLLRSAGVGIMQGKISETLTFLNTETSKPLLDYKPGEFELMCSYLSFRYWYSRADIDEVFRTIYPNFGEFFKKAGYSDDFSRKALYSIFKRHLYYQNIYKYGRTIGRLFNFIIRNYNEKMLR